MKWRNWYKTPTLWKSLRKYRIIIFWQSYQFYIFLLSKWDFGKQSLITKEVEAKGYLSVSLCLCISLPIYDFWKFVLQLCFTISLKCIKTFSLFPFQKFCDIKVAIYTYIFHSFISAIEPFFYQWTQKVRWGTISIISVQLVWHMISMV